MSASESSVATFVKQGFDGFRGKTLEERVQELIDREEIRELVARYAQRVSQRLTMTDMFVENGEFIVRMPGQPVQVARGHQQLEHAFATAAARPSLSMPAVHNQVISISGDEATGTAWVELYTLENNQRTFTGCGYYADRLRRVDGRWKFVARDATVVVTGSAQPVQYVPTK